MIGRRFLSLACSWSRTGCTQEAERERERRGGERTGKNVKGRRTGTSGTGVFARKWTRIGALCENEKVTKAEGKDVYTHIYA